MRAPDTSRRLELWGGVECTLHRVGDTFASQIDRSGHADRADDLHRIASLGVRTLRYPVLWEATAPDGPESADWRFADERLGTLRELGIAPIVGLLHHGSGPLPGGLLDDGFAEGLASFAGEVARRFPWVQDWTPVNEPLTTARFSALYGVWYPHLRDRRAFVEAVLNQCKATVLAMRRIREVNPAARLVQTEDLGRSYATAPLTSLANFYNERRWLTWDLLCGRVSASHILWPWLIESGVAPEALQWFGDNNCPPDVLGVNYYVTGERWLDHRVERYPARYQSECDGVAVADIETARCLATPTAGLQPLLEEAWSRYGLPMAVTEAHIDSSREDQLRWLRDVWHAAEAARVCGADVRAVTVWALFGSYDWNSLLTESRGYYEPGPFDVRGPLPRPTAVATLMRELVSGRPPSHPALHGEGWWRRPGRFFCEPVTRRTVALPPPWNRSSFDARYARPILVSGATGTLGSAFARACRERALACVVLGRADFDIADRDSVATALARHRPWAVINASGYVRIDEAEVDVERCMRENAAGPAILAAQCSAAGIALLTFSSDQVFDGRRDGPWLESDAPAPLNVYGRSKASAERAVLTAHDAALVVRTSAFFGAWDSQNFIHHLLEAWSRGEAPEVDDALTVSPTYVPDLVRVCLDLLVDGERGLWHLANEGAVTWHELATKVAALTGNADRAIARPAAASRGGAARPRNAALGSERGRLMPSLDDALMRFLAERQRLGERASAPVAFVAEDVPDDVVSVGT